MKSVFFVLSLVIFASAANAYPLDLNWSDEFLLSQAFQQLTTVTDDRDSNVQKLSVALNGSTVAGMRYETAHTNGTIDYGDFSLAQIEAPAGVVLAAEQGHNAIILHGTADSVAGTGTLRISILTNGLMNDYKDCNARLSRDQIGQWHLINIYTGKVITNLFVKTWALGITTVQGLCKD